MSSPSTVSTSKTKAPTGEWIRGIVFTALFAALFIAASFIKIPLGFSPIPISLQTFAVLVAGGLLGAVYGFWSIFIVVALTAIGLPLMNGSGGLAQILGPTGGFIWMFPIAAFLVGFVCDRLFATRRKLAIRGQIWLLLTVAAASLLLYVTGVPWLAHYSDALDLNGAITKGMLPFLPGDAIKSVAAALVISSLRPVLPIIRSSRRKDN